MTEKIVAARAEALGKGNQRSRSIARATPKPRRGIQSVGIGFRVLAALSAEAGPATLTEVARRAGLSMSQTHRYLASLIAAGMVRQDGSTGRYDLGPEAIRVGLAALARIDVFAQSDLPVAAFTQETGRTTLVAILGPAGPTIVRWHAGPRPVVTSLSVGSVLPLMTSATGRVFLSFLPDEEVAAALKRYAAGASVKAADVKAIRRRVRSDMSASVDETLIPGLRATAVPILNLQGFPALVVTAIASSATDRRPDAAIVHRLKALGRSLTEQIGGRWPAQS
ncbi:MAG: IclR family transcriptional regulator [Xanthobacteraceae bacterium]